MLPIRARRTVPNHPNCSRAVRMGAGARAVAFVGACAYLVRDWILRTPTRGSCCPGDHLVGGVRTVGGRVMRSITPVSAGGSRAEPRRLRSGDDACGEQSRSD